MKRNAIMDFASLVIFEVRQLYSIEQQLIDAIPRMMVRAGNKDLKKLLEEHTQATIRQRDRLKDIAGKLGIEPEGEPARGMHALIAETEEILGSYEIGKSLRDALIIMFAQRIEHMEISAYGTAIAHAGLMDKPDIVGLLKESIEEEKSADGQLTKLANSQINEHAKHIKEPSNFYGRHG